MLDLDLFIGLIFILMCSNVGTYVLSVNSSFICHCNAIYCIVSGLLFSFSRSNGPLQYIFRMPCCSILSVKGKIWIQITLWVRSLLCDYYSTPDVYFLEEFVKCAVCPYKRWR
jgi:hypothetical protein